MIFRAYLLGFIYVWERSYICEAIVAEQFFIAFPINNQGIFAGILSFPSHADVDSLGDAVYRTASFRTVRAHFCQNA